MTSRDWLELVAGLLTFLCVVPYLRDTMRGRTRPHRASWFIFAALSAVAAASQFAARSDAGAYLASGAALGFALVFLASLRRGVGGVSRTDVLATTVGIGGVIASIVAREPLIALLSVIVAEGTAIALTVVKALRDPDSETASTWAIDSLAGAVALLAIPEWTAEQWLYPVHHLTANLVVLIAVLHGRRSHAATLRTVSHGRDERSVSP